MGSKVLWTHLLGKDVPVDDSPLSMAPPIVPQDRVGTSMRVLVHDTQSRLDGLSTKLDGLFTQVGDTRSQITDANKALAEITKSGEPERVCSPTNDADPTQVGRSQSELTARIGALGQTQTLELVRASQANTENALRTLEKRIDALQTAQEQQNLLLQQTVIPLLPLLQTLPVQLEAMMRTVCVELGSKIDGVKDGRHATSQRSPKRPRLEVPPHGSSMGAMPRSHAMSPVITRSARLVQRQLVTPSNHRWDDGTGPGSRSIPPFATPISRAVVQDTPSGKHRAPPPSSCGPSMSLRDRRAQMSLVGVVVIYLRFTLTLTWAKAGASLAVKTVHIPQDVL